MEGGREGEGGRAEKERGIAWGEDEGGCERAGKGQEEGEPPYVSCSSTAAHGPCLLSLPDVIALSPEDEGVVKREREAKGREASG